MPRTTSRKQSSGRKKYPDPVGSLRLWRGAGGNRPILIGFCSINEGTYEVAIWKKNGKLNGGLSVGHGDNQERMYYINVQKGEKGQYGYINAVDEDDDESFTFNLRQDEHGGYWASVAPSTKSSNTKTKSKTTKRRGKADEDDDMFDEDDDDEELDDDLDLDEDDEDDEDDTEWIADSDDEDEDDEDEEDEEEEDEPVRRNPRSTASRRTPPAKPTANTKAKAAVSRRKLR